MLTGAPADALDLPAAAIELLDVLRALSSAIEAAPLAVLIAAVLAAVVPATALVFAVPDATAPEVLTQMSRKLSGFCQKRGASSITT